MFNKVSKKIRVEKRPLAGEDLQQGISEPGKSAAVTYVPDDQKIPVEIKEIVRIKPQEFAALKNSFEEWAKQWD
jgi:hypothetical protein